MCKPFEKHHLNTDVINTDVINVFLEAQELGKLSFQNRQKIQSELLYGSLTEQDYIAINRIVHAVRHGWLALD
ncbi:MAG: hypothetical protein AAF685_07630 [Cyanobacteria bacterium P01_C01_bin.89]